MAIAAKLLDGDSGEKGGGGFVRKFLQDATPTWSSRQNLQVQSQNDEGARGEANASTSIGRPATTYVNSASDDSVSAVAVLTRHLIKFYSDLGSKNPERIPPLHG